MMLRFLVVTSLVLLGGCKGLSTPGFGSCLHETTQAVLRDELRKYIVQSIRFRLEGPTNARSIDTAEISAIVASLNIEFKQVVTKRADPNSTKVFCRTTVSVKLDAETTREATGYTESVGLESLASAGRTYGVRSNAGRLEFPIEYSAQPTDDSSSVIVETEREPHGPIDMFGEILSGALIGVYRDSNNNTGQENHSVAHSLQEQNAPMSSSTEGLASAADVAELFYLSLGRGDGVTANSLIIPEKRGMNAYRPESIASFYGSLYSPLEIDAIFSLDDSRVRVSYNYTQSTRPCVNSSIVKTVVRGGQRLIESISTGGGCG